MRLTTAALFSILIAAPAVDAQPPAELVPVVGEVARRVRMVGAQHGDSIWPGFRPDTIPLLAVVRERGTFLLNWNAPLPEGFVPVPALPGAGWREERALGAANTGTQLAGRPAAMFVLAAGGTVASLVPLAVHEAFHVFQAASRRPGRRFGRGEQSMLTAQYPLFDAANEAGVALEGRLLREALQATDAAARRTRAQEFVAVREARQRRLAADFAEYERMTELNEGLAEYAQRRTLLLLAQDADDAVRAASRAALARLEAQLDDLVGDGTLSVRQRFYATGPAMAHLLDVLAGARWRAALVARDQTLQDALAEASGAREREAALLAAADARHDTAALRTNAERAVAELQARRRAQVDSVLARPGVQLVVDASALPGGAPNLCGFDPLNQLRATAALVLHTRWLRPCNGSAYAGEFNTPVVQDERAGTLTAVVGAEPEVALTVAGVARTLADGERVTGAADVRLVTPTATYQAARADLERRGRVLRLVLRP